MRFSAFVRCSGADGRKWTPSPGAFRTISEVATDLEVPQHVLRFWESKFQQIRPLKRGGGRRYYRPEDIQLIGNIKDLLYNQGFTIRGVQKVLKERGLRHVTDLGRGELRVAEPPQPRVQVIEKIVYVERPVPMPMHVPAPAPKKPRTYARGSRKPKVKKMVRGQAKR